MKKYLLYIYILLLGCTVGKPILSQTTIQAKFSPIGIHPFDSRNKQLYTNTIDANANFTVEPMIIIPIETFIRGDFLSWRFAPGLLADAAGQPAFFIHLGLKRRIVQIWRNSFSLALGGNLYGREIWRNFPNYNLDDSWSQNGSWEYKLGIMAELEYALYLNDNNDITLSLLYGHQEETFTFTVGYRYWFSNIIKNPPRCGNCPFDDTRQHWTP